ncbi:MAG TPA: DUF2911 domain-containing protein [Thermoanaerobaculia bacterium]|nr:DUF2911 domain-containing protein [Thermoanaerobaculia bacterium]
MKIHALVAAALFTAVGALAQPAIPMPDVSQKASVAQTIGITDIDIHYHRPSVNNRKIFGGLVPYDVIWRSGANENTLISFSTPVKIEGQPLAAGKYSLFFVPGPQQWTVVVNKFTGGWGTYSYDQSEDALRVKVTPQTAELQEQLAYTFDNPAASSVVAAMRWDKVRVPVKIEVDLNATVKQSIADSLRSGKHWDPNAWAAAARWALQQKDTDAALDYANHSLAVGQNSSNLRLKARILELKGDAKGAAELRDRAKLIYNDAENIYIPAYALAGQKKYDEAVAQLDAWIAAHPQHAELWRAQSVAGDMYVAKGDKAKARERFDKAMALAKDQTERTEVQDSINGMEAEIAPAK